MTEIDPAIWHQPQMRRALAHHDIAAVFQLLRSAGIRQRELAEMLGWQQSAVSEVVHGRRVQSYATLERICVRLGLPRGLMGLSYGDGDPPAQLDEGHPRSFVARVSTVLFGRPILTEFGPLPLSGEPPARVGRADAAEISDFTARFRALDRTHGGVVFADTVSAVARRLTRMLDADATDETRMRLGAAVSDLHCLAGWTAFDAGHIDSARWHYLRALELAVAAGEHVLATHILYSIGRLYQHCGAPNEALKYYQLATFRLDGRRGDGRASTALLAASSAWAYGELGRQDEALRHLETAQEESQDAESTALVARVVGGFALFSIGQVDEGIHAVTDYLKARNDDPAHARTRCRSLARLAIANLHDGNLKAGIAVAATCLSLAQRLSSRTVQDHLTQLEKAAASRRDSTCRDLAERIRLVQNM